MDYFSVEVRRRSSRSATLGIAGELDLATSPYLEASLAELSGTVLIDCVDLRFVDASGIGVLVAASMRLHLRLANVTPFVRRVFVIAGAESLLAPTLSPVERAGLLGSRARFAMKAARNATDDARRLRALGHPDPDESTAPDASEECS